MKKIVFLYSGEGTHGTETSTAIFKTSDRWQETENLLMEKFNMDLDRLWNENTGSHAGSFSVLRTLISQICLADLWSRWGYPPDILAGHSTGELAAAFEAGFYSLDQVLSLARDIGIVAAKLEGRMAHGWVSDPNEIDLHVSSINFTHKRRGIHVTLSDFPDRIDAYLDRNPEFTPMPLPHPWHHPAYAPYTDLLEPREAASVETGRFISGVTGRWETCLSDTHWQDWLVRPINFIAAMDTLTESHPDTDFTVIEIGAHPVLSQSCRGLEEYIHVPSLCRGEPDVPFILAQRRKLDPGNFDTIFNKTVDGFRPGLDFNESLAFQGLTSMDFTRLAQELSPLFPGLKPQDFYRYRTLTDLKERFGQNSETAAPKPLPSKASEVVIAGASCRFPASVETLDQFWQTLTKGDDQVRPADGRGDDAAGYLADRVSRFDHGFFNIPAAEAKTMDPQQILALELTEMLFRDAGLRPEDLDRNRIGVYIGAWNLEFGGDRSSVFYPTGINPSIIASRISYQYDLRGPSWVVNTACSSSLVAVHYAAKDVEAGRVDYAIAGGVNMLLDESFTENMKQSGFLSPEQRCKAFDDAADGYVRAEGGGLVLLTTKDLAPDWYATLRGSSVNQNGRRSQVITAPHPEAQEYLIRDACRDAGIRPADIAYVETHGTGTRIGDPIEMSALQNTVGVDREDICWVGSVKSNIGHLESAAGMAGLLKTLGILNYGKIPKNLHFHTPNTHIDFNAGPVQVAGTETPVDQESFIGISSFGFGGANAHIVLEGVPESNRKPIAAAVSPFNRENAIPLSDFLTRAAPDAAPSEPPRDTSVESSDPP